MTSGVVFVFSPALFPRSTMENYFVFAHGTILEVKSRKGEVIFRVKDEKGEWEGYLEEKNAQTLVEGQVVRAYGTISPQPDGKNVLACKWIKHVNGEEKEFCEKKTLEEWENVVREHSTLNGLKPFERPTPKIVNIEHETLNVTKDEPQEFISAAEIKVEREYL